MNVYVELLMTALVLLSEAFIVHSYSSYLFSYKSAKLKTACAYLAGYTCLLLLAVLVGNPIINAIAYTVVNLLILNAFFLCGFVSAIFHSTVLTALMCLSEILCSVVISLYTQDYSAYQVRISVFVALFVISKLIYVLLCVLSAKAFSQHKSGTYENKSMWKLCLLPLSSVFVAVIVVYISMYVELPMDLQIAVSVCLGVLFFANIYTIGIYNKTEKVNYDNMTMKLALLKDESNAEFYKMLQEQYDRQRILIHDVKNHMQIVNSLAVDGKTDEIQEYITKWGFDKAFQSQTRYSDNDILNIIISRLANDCKLNKIDLLCDIRDHCISFIDDIDVAALFGNLLSNAFDSAVKSTKKFIEIDIQIKPVQKTTIIRIVNSCDSKPKKSSDGLFISNKEDKEYHGVGQKSIARIVKKYNGTAENYYDENKKQFDWIIVFPMK